MINVGPYVVVEKGRYQYGLFPKYFMMSLAIY